MIEGLRRVQHVDKEAKWAADGLHGMYEVIMLYAWVCNASRGLGVMVACSCQVLARSCIHNT